MFRVSPSNLKDAAGLDCSRSGRFSRPHGSPLSLPPYGSPAAPMRSVGEASIDFGNRSRAALGSRRGFDVFSRSRAVELLSRSHRRCPEPFHAKPDQHKALCRSRSSSKHPTEPGLLTHYLLLCWRVGQAGVECLLKRVAIQPAGYSEKDHLCTRRRIAPWFPNRYRNPHADNLENGATARCFCQIDDSLGAKDGFGQVLQHSA